MIAFTYAVSGLLLAGSGWLFVHDLLDATQQTIVWTVIFFFASSAAGAAYLTASEIFPVEIRALAIAFFTRPAPRLAVLERRFYLAA